jgi:hypothetical protein
MAASALGGGAPGYGDRLMADGVVAEFWPGRAGAGEEEPGRGGTAPGAGGGEPPQHWSPADREEFAALPEAARAPFMRMYKRMEAGFTPRLQRGAALEKDYGELDRAVFTPEQRAVLAQRGTTPAALIASWANVERLLDRTCNPDERLRSDIVARIIWNYDVDPSQVAQLLNQLRQGGGQLPAAAGAVSPISLQRLDAPENDRVVRQHATYEPRSKRPTGR